MDDVGLFERDGVVVFWDFTVGVVVPRGNVVRVAVKWTAIAALGLKENHRVVGFNGAGEQTLGVARVGAVHHLEAGRVRELRFG